MHPAADTSDEAEQLTFEKSESSNVMKQKLDEIQNMAGQHLGKMRNKCGKFVTGQLWFECYLNPYILNAASSSSLSRKIDSSACDQNESQGLW